MANDEQWTQDAGETGDERLRPTAFGGHCFYVRKCVTGREIAGNFARREVGGIELPQRSADYSEFAVVLAKGANVGKKCTKEHAKTFKRHRRLYDAVRVGDMLRLPPDHSGIRRRDAAVGGECHWEAWVEESVPLGIVEEW